jgi:hypothetical protein
MEIEEVFIDETNLELEQENVGTKEEQPKMSIDQLKKMNINQLKTIAIQCGIAVDTSKLKKHELITLIVNA